MTISLSNSSLTLLDYSEVRAAQLKILLFDIVGFVSYAALLYVYCILWEGLACTLLLLSTQLIIGMVVTRLHHSLGRITKCKTHLIDPSILGLGWNIEKADLKLEELDSIFQYTLAEIPEQNLDNIDDFNDIAWFIILIWSVISSIIANFFFIDSIFCITGALVTALVCTMTFINSYRSTDLGNLRDNLYHLEFFARSRLSKFTLIENGFRRNLFVEWISKNGKVALNDLGFVIAVRQYDTEHCSITYHLGLPSKMNERFEIEGMWIPEPHIIEQLKLLTLKSNWSIEHEFSENYTMIRFCNDLAAGLSKMQNMAAINIDEVENKSNEVLELLRHILDICSI